MTSILSSPSQLKFERKKTHNVTCSTHFSNALYSFPVRSANEVEAGTLSVRNSRVETMSLPFYVALKEHLDVLSTLINYENFQPTCSRRKSYLHLRKIPTTGTLITWGCSTKVKGQKVPYYTAMRNLRGCRKVPQQRFVFLQQLRQVYFGDFETVVLIVRSVTGSSHDPDSTSRGCHNLRLRCKFSWHASPFNRSSFRQLTRC